MAVLEEYNDFLDSEIRFHDKHCFEMKLDIELSSLKKNSYKVETYFLFQKLSISVRAIMVKRIFIIILRGIQDLKLQR